MSIADQRWQTLFEQSPNGIVLADAKGVMVLVNDRMTRLFGYSQQELLGEPIEMLVQEPLRPAHRQHRDEFTRSPRSQVMASGRRLVGLHRDGHEIPVEVGLSAFEVDGAVWTMGIVHDVSSREQAIDQLRIQSAALDAAANGIAISTPDGRCQWVNPAFTRMTGYNPDEIVGQPLSLLKSGVHDDAFFRDLWITIASGQPWSGEIVNRRKNGSLYTEEQTIAPVFDDAGAITHYVAIKSDVSDRKQMEAEIRAANVRLAQQLEEIRQLRDELQEQAIRDPLTQLHNRRYLDETLAKDVASAERFNRPLAVALLDVDHFKLINDDHGHATGDLVLRQLADTLRALTRQTDLVCRYGGEEFVVVMPGARFFQAEARANQWRETLSAAALDVGRTRITYTVSIGVAEHRLGAESIAETFARADVALYEAKRAGRDRVVSAEEGVTIPPGPRSPDSTRSLPPGG